MGSARYLNLVRYIEYVKDTYEDAYSDYEDKSFIPVFEHFRVDSCFDLVRYLVPMGDDTTQSARYERVLTMTRTLRDVYHSEYRDLPMYNKYLDCREYTGYLP